MSALSNINVPLIVNSHVAFNPRKACLVALTITVAPVTIASLEAIVQQIGVEGFQLDEISIGENIQATLGNITSWLGNVAIRLGNRFPGSLRMDWSS
jgi:hypothetical protein